MESTVVLILILVTIMALQAPAYSEKIYATMNPVPVGGKVTLSSPVSISSGIWMFKNDVIILISPGQEIISNIWKDRITYHASANLSSFTINSLKLEDSGEYQLMVMNSFTAKLNLSVQVPVSNVTLRANATNLVEFNDTAVLMCSASSGTSLSYVWLMGSSVVTAGGGGVILGNGGATLFIVGVTRYDEGPFRCNVSNGVSHEISPPVSLNVSYGPSNTTMMLTPMKYIYRTGSNIMLSCSADSRPPATIKWMANGVYLNSFGPNLQLTRVTNSSAGNYQCVFHNTVTSRFSSADANIRVMEPIAAAVVYDTDEAAILNATFTLHCGVTGPADSITWWKAGQLISPGSTIDFGMGNKTLNFNPVQLSDNGYYECQAFNYVSNMISNVYTLEVNYGPMKPVLMGPSLALTGTWVTLSCSSISQPPSQIRWYFDHSLVATMSGITIGPLTSDIIQKYTCMAFNNITGKNSSAYIILTILAPVTMASIKVVGAEPIVNRIFKLTCETAGNVDSITWLHGSSPLNANSTRHIKIENATLTFDPVMHSDNGDYRCVASNPLSSLTSDIFTLHVYYGPDVPKIMGPDVALPKDIITLICTASSNPPSVYQWYFNNSVVANTSEYVTPPFTKDMSGIYTCVAFNSITGKNSSAHIPLTVGDPIKEAHVEATMKPAIEGYFYNLTCKVTGTAKHVYWIKNGEQLHGDSRIVFYHDNRTVTFKPLESKDTGKYQCITINAVWNMTSPPYNLLVNFGPEALMIDGPAFAQTGQTVVYHCSAKSVPPSQFSWWYNGSMVANTSVFTTDPLSFNMSGEYTCVAYNDVTRKNSTSSKILTVIEAVQSLMIRSNTVPINSADFTLICDVIGPYDKIQWMKNSKPLNMSTSTTSYHSKDNMLDFTPVTVGDDGTYQCVATNKAGPHTSPTYTLLVNYGPLTVSISGPSSVQTGHSVSLTCSADSRPECDFYWFINNQTSPHQNGSVFIYTATEKKEVNFTCKARNPVTKITLYQTKAFTVSHAAALHIPSFGGLMLMGVFALSVTVPHS